MISARELSVRKKCLTPTELPISLGTG